MRQKDELLIKRKSLSHTEWYTEVHLEEKGFEPRLASNERTRTWGTRRGISGETPALLFAAFDQRVDGVVFDYRMHGSFFRHL